jgi:hypothetical protein
VLLRTPVVVEPTPVGEAVRIDPAFVSIAVGRNRGLPYNLATGDWMQTQMSGAWPVGFAPPAGICNLM